MIENVDFNFIKEQEGFKTTGYVPVDKDGKVLGSSGVTVASGFDLGQRGINDLQGLPKELVKKLSPFVGLQGSKALNSANKLVLTNEEALTVNKFAKKQELGRLSKKWKAETGTDFSSLPKEQATAIASVAFQYGDLETKAPNFWNQVTTGNWDGAKKNLANFGDKYDSRRKRELEYLNQYKEQEKAPKNAPSVSSYEQYMQAAENENAALMPNFGAPKVEAAPEVRPNFKVAGGYNPNKAAENVMSQYGKRPKEVITDTETITEEGPGFIDRFTSGFKELYPFNEGGPVEEQITTETPNFYANQNITDIPRDGTYTLPPDQIITPFIRETIKEDVTVQPIIQAGDVDVSRQGPYQRSENDRMQEAARRSMMQGNYEERMADYEDARYNAQQNPGSYPARIVEPTPPPMQAAQRMMGGRMRYAQGGTVNQAQGLASLGRGGDSTLVHMQPQEVAGLQQLAQANGTSLTRNPMTGYPEAFSLGGMFKAALPIAAGYFTGGAGAGLMSSFGTYAPLAAGAATGAAVAAVTGDDPIMGAVSGGLGGMSGGGLNTAMMGPTNATGMKVQGSLGGMAGASPYKGAATGTAMPGYSFGQTQTPTVGVSGLETGGGALADGTIPQTDVVKQIPSGGSNNLNIPRQGAVDFSGSFNQGLDQVYRNLGTVDPTTGLIKDASTMDVIKTLGSPVASLGLGGLEQSDFINEPDFDDPRDKYNPYSKLNLSNDTGISKSLAADTGLRLFAEGGNVAGNQKQALNLNSGSNVAGNNAGLRGLNLDTGMMGVSAADLAAAAMAKQMTSTPGQNVGGSTNQPFTMSTRKEYGTGGPNEVPEDYRGGLDSNYDIDIAGNFRRKAQGGMIRGYAEGGYLQGPGDGMSDDIPATINGDEPAALADGEFVVPADVVSHLGNGSSEAGSKQLYAMMDRIRKARTGRESQGKEIKPGKYMPS